MHPLTFMRYLGLLLWCLLSSNALAAQLDDWAADGAALVASDGGVRARSVQRIAERGGPHALAVLEALNDGTLQIDTTGLAYRRQSNTALEPLLPNVQRAPRLPLSSPVVDNELRRQLELSLATLRLTAPDSKIRAVAAENLAKQPNENLVPLVRRVLHGEREPRVRQALGLVLAWTDVTSTNDGDRIRALESIAVSPNPAFKPAVERLLVQGADRQPTEKSQAVRVAASKALSAIHWRETWTGVASNLFHGLSLASVLLLVSLGLAITFGLMRVINMAHGELLMIGTYATYVVQQFFQKYWPNHSDWYLVAAVPAAFIASAGVGMLIERLVLRFLHGRPLETLLATWGVSLVLIQIVRQIFGAQNVTVANPRALSGGTELFVGFVLTYNRLCVIAFSLLVVAFVWFILRRTRLGLQVRALTQNREMAACMGIATRRVDSWTFAMGAGVAGLGGVALSQLGNVGPELGQGYIIDAFMVVVLGGVGNLAGTFAGALGLGIATKWAEPIVGAVLGKILILTLIVLFIQRRPQGLFALRGRAVEV
jgi:urea transport system permease protein